MGDGTGISWTDATWSPARGCSRAPRPRFSLSHAPALADAALADDWSPNIRVVAQDLAAIVKALVPLAEAARAWRVGRERDRVGTAPPGGQRSASGVALIDAVDALDKEQQP